MAPSSSRTPPPTTNTSAGASSAKKAEGKSNGGMKRVFLLITTIVPLTALFMNQLPSFTVTDTACRWSSCLTPYLVGADVVKRVQEDYLDRLTTRLPDFGTYEHNRTMYWGTYRPNVLLGIKGRTRHSLLVGIAWYDGLNYFGVRHDATESDHILFRWEYHDGRFYGQEKIVDVENKLAFEIHFVKTPDGTGWDLRVTCIRQTSHPLYFVVYFAHDGGAVKYPLSVVSPDESDTAGDTTIVKGFVDVPSSEDQSASSRRSGFTATLSDSCPSLANRSSEWALYGFSKPVDQAWSFDIKQTPGLIRHPSSEYHQRHKKDNVLVFKKLFTSDFRVEISLQEDGAGMKKGTSSSLDDVAPARLSSCQLTSMHAFLQKTFVEKFEELFFRHARESQPNSPQAAASSTAIKNAPRHAKLANQHKKLLSMASSALSNMLGGMGYWEGKYLRVSKELDELSDQQGREVKTMPNGQPSTVDETPFEISLFSAVPSRAKFPRGFLWDEGFHQLLISRWDAEITKDVISHWFITASDPESGWIPREQILNPESRSRVPREFTPQHPLHANPPSMVLAIQNFALYRGNLTSGDLAFLRRVLPKLRKWRDWFHQTQCGGSANCSSTPRPFPIASNEEPTNAEAKQGKQVDDALKYRWRSRNGFHLLACGLDDYPRPVCRHHRKELHVDLFSWMAMMTRTMNAIDDALGSGRRDAEEGNNHREQPQQQELPWESLLVDLHWDAENRRFADVTGCPPATATTRGAQQQQQQQLKKPPTFSQHFSPYVGYVSLFPFLTMTIDDADKARAVLRLAKNELSTGFGLASVSKTSRDLLSYYRLQHENYWTGPIWMNINYLFLRALKLKYCALLGEEAHEFYETLRLDLLENVLHEFDRTGKLWENYHWETGKGQGTAPFTGWTALIVLIMGEQYA